MAFAGRRRREDLRGVWIAESLGGSPFSCRSKLGGSDDPWLSRQVRGSSGTLGSYASATSYVTRTNDPSPRLGRQYPRPASK